MTNIIVGITIFSVILIASIITYFIDVVNNKISEILGLIGYIGLVIFFSLIFSPYIAFLFLALTVILGIICYKTKSIDDWVAAILGGFFLLFLIFEIYVLFIL